MELHFPSVTMRKIASYLDAFSLLQVAQVNKSWNAVANRDVLWKKLCLMRWFFCEDVPLQLLNTQTWKQYFLSRTWQERAKTRANPEDFIYKEIPVEWGVQGNACYISGRGLTRNGQGKSVVCLLTSMTKFITWDIHEGFTTWVSPVQPSCIMMLTTLPEMHIAVTVDVDGIIKLWNCHSKEALASNNIQSPCQSLSAVITKDGPVVLTGDTSGNLLIFRIPDLHLISRINVFRYGINQMFCSPQSKWVFVNKKHPHILPKVFLMSSLLRTSEFFAPVATILPVSLCQRVSWIPRREDRITLMSRSGPKKITKFNTFDINLQEVGNKIVAEGRLAASFSLPDYVESPAWMGVSDKNVIVCSTGSSLSLYSLKGLCLQTFYYYPEDVLRIMVDPLHVIVTLIDGSMDVYAWEERRPILKKCYQLQNRRYMLRQSVIKKTLCDDVSIIRMMTNNPDCSFLMIYTLDI